MQDHNVSAEMARSAAGPGTFNRLGLPPMQQKKFTNFSRSVVSNGKKQEKKVLGDFSNQFANRSKNDEIESDISSDDLAVHHRLPINGQILEVADELLESSRVLSSNVYNKPI